MGVVVLFWVVLLFFCWGCCYICGVSSHVRGFRAVDSDVGRR